MAHTIRKQQQSRYGSHMTHFAPQQLNPPHHCHGLPQGTGTQKQLQADPCPAGLPQLWDMGLQSCQDLYAVSTSSESLRDRCREAKEPMNTKSKTQVFWGVTLCWWASSVHYFKISWCLNHQGQTVQKDCWTLNILQNKARYSPNDEVSHSTMSVSSSIATITSHFTQRLLYPAMNIMVQDRLL